MEKFREFPGSSIHLQPVTRDLGVNLLAPSIDASAQAKGFMESMPAKPRDLVEHMPTAVIVQKNLRRRIPGKYRLLELLREKFRRLDLHRLVFFSRPDIDESEALQFRMGLDRLDQHRKIMPMAVEQMSKHLPRIQLRSGAKFGQRFLVGKRAALATAEMIAGKKRALGPRQSLHEVTHRRIRIQFISSHAATIPAPAPSATHRFSIVHPPVPVKDSGA